MNKQNHNNKNTIKKPSMAGEKLLERISAYILATAFLMLVGLVNKNGPLSGFPFPWLFNMKHLIIQYFVPSLAFTAAAVVGADLLARMFINLKEPRLKVHTKPPKLTSSYNEDVEISEADTAASKYRDMSKDAEDGDDNLSSIQKRNILEAQKKYRQQLRERPATKNSKSKKRSSGFAGYAILALVFAFTVLPAILALTVSDEYSDNDVEWYYDDPDIDSSENAVNNELYNLLDHLEARDYEWFERFAGKEEIDKIYAISDWSEASLNVYPIYNYVSEEKKTGISKCVIVEDYESDESYLLAAKMKMQNSEEEGWTAETVGFSISANPVEFEDTDEISNEDLITHAKDILINSKNCGDTKIGGVSILTWDPDRDIFGREKTTES